MTKKDEVLDEGVFNAAVAAGQQKKPVYAGTFDQQLQDIYDQISNRPDFKYDVNADPLYQQYKDQYIQQGKLAMKDTMGKAAALTGGYGSTYGQQVGQQTYDAYLQNLSAVIPELYGAAYDKYKDKGDDLIKQYGLLGEQRDTEYARYRDEMNDWEAEREYARQLETEEYNRKLTEDQAAYTRQQQAYANLYAIIKASGYAPTDAELQAAGMTREASQALQNEYYRVNGINPNAGAGSGGGGGDWSSSPGRDSKKKDTTTSDTDGIDRRMVSVIGTSIGNAKTKEQFVKAIANADKYVDSMSNAQYAAYKNAVTAAAQKFR